MGAVMESNPGGSDSDPAMTRPDRRWNEDQESTGVFSEDDELDFAATYVFETDMVADYMREQGLETPLPPMSSTQERRARHNSGSYPISDPGSAPERAPHYSSGTFEAFDDGSHMPLDTPETAATCVFDTSLLHDTGGGTDVFDTSDHGLAPAETSLFDEPEDLEDTCIVIRDADDFAATHRLVDDTPDDDIPTSVALPEKTQDISTAIDEVLSTPPSANPPLSAYAGLKQTAPHHLAVRYVDMPLPQVPSVHPAHRRNMIAALICVIVALIAVIGAMATLLLA